MPVYEYRCQDGHLYDKTEGFDAPREQACLVCGQPARRQISLPAVIFRGSGFYSTDNRKTGTNGRSHESEREPVGSSSDGDGHGHSHGDGGHSHSSGSTSKAEAAPSD